METLPLFATPVFISDEYAITAAEHGVLTSQAWQSNAGGNKASTDSYVLNRPELAGLRGFLQAQVETFVFQVLRVKRQCSFYITQSWMNLNEPGTQHHLHAHQNSLLSGVYFLEGADSPIVFRRPASHNLFGNIHLTFDELNVMNAGDYRFAAQKNRAILFPSTTQHLVAPNQSDVPRMSLAFNTFARGRLGSPDELTDLPL